MVRKNDSLKKKDGGLKMEKNGGNESRVQKEKIKAHHL